MTSQVCDCYVLRHQCRESLLPTPWLTAPLLTSTVVALTLVAKQVRRQMLTHHMPPRMPQEARTLQATRQQQ